MNPTKFYVTPDLYASKGQRLSNMLIDIMGYYSLAFILGLFLGILELLGVSGILEFISNMSVFENLILVFFLNLIYFGVFELLTQRTLGKFLSKTKVVLRDGSKPTIDEILIRSLCRFIPFDLFSFLGTDGKGWHDTISKTYVVDVNKFEAKRNAANEIEQIGITENN